MCVWACVLQLRDINYERMINGELEAESDAVTQAFGNRVTFMNTLLSYRQHSPNARVRHLDHKSNNHYSGFTLIKSSKFGLLSLFRRFSTHESTTVWNLRTKKILLSGSGIPNSTVHDLARIGNDLYVYSREVEQDGSVLIYDIKRRVKHTFVLDNILLSGSKFVKMYDRFLLIGNDDENSIEVYLFNPTVEVEPRDAGIQHEAVGQDEGEQENPWVRRGNLFPEEVALPLMNQIKQKKTSSISLWRYGRLAAAQLLNYKSKSLLMMSFANSKHAHFLNLKNNTITKVKIGDSPLHSDGHKTHILFDEKYCRLITLANESEMHLTELQHLFQ